MLRAALGATGKFQNILLCFIVESYDIRHRRFAFGQSRGFIKSNAFDFISPLKRFAALD